MGAEPTRKEIAESAAAAFEQLTKARLTAESGLDVVLRSTRKSDGNEGWLELALSNEAHTTIVHDAVEFLSDCAGKRLVAYLDDCAEDDTISYVTTSEFPDFANSFEDARTVNLERYSPSADVARLDVRAATFTRTSRPNIVLIAPAQVSLLGKTKHSFRFGSANEITPVKGEIVQIGRDYSFAIFDNFYFITDETKFENLTGFSDLIQKRASIAISKLQAIRDVEFGDIAALENASLNREFARKLAAAHALGVFDKMSQKTIIDDIRKNNVAIRHEMNGKKLVLHPDLSDKSGRRDLIDLLVENLWISSSGQPYRALKKAKR